MKTDTPLVSVVMPVYKTEKYLKTSVESVIAQSYDNLEILLVDDGSPDNSPHICDMFAEKYDNIKAFHKNNGGLSDARNYGINNANGKYIFFLDSDDTIDKETISLMVEIAENENSDIVLPDRYYKCFEENDNKELCYLFDEEFCTENPLQFAKNVIIARGCAWRATSVLYRTEMIIENHCYFPVGYTSEDVVFNLMVMSYANKCSFIKKPTLNYLKRSGSITTTFNENFFDNILYIDSEVGKFFSRNCIATNENNRIRDSLLIRNYIVYLLSVYSKNNNLKSKEKRAIVDVVLGDARVVESMKTKMIVPYFNKRVLGTIIVMIHGLLKMKCKAIAVAIMKLIGRMR